MVGIFQKMIAPYARQLRLMVGRAIVRLVDDAAPVQRLQLSILEGETVDKIDRIQNYGFTSVPLPGAQAIPLAVSGCRDHCVAVAVDDGRYRIRNLDGGEVALYDDQGLVLRLTRDKHIHLYGCDQLVVDAAVKVQLNTPLLNVSGDIKAGGSITATTNVYDANGAKSMSGMRGTYNGHHHGTSPTPTEAM